jgi:hypothetical protein
MAAPCGACGGTRSTSVVSLSSSDGSSSSAASEAGDDAEVDADGDESLADDSTDGSAPPALDGDGDAEHEPAATRGVTEPEPEMKNLDLRPLSACGMLTTLRLRDHTGVASLRGLAGCTALVSLDAAGCTRLRTLAGVDGCASLRVLDASHCSALEHVAHLSRCPSLAEIKLLNCPSLREGLASLVAVLKGAPRAALRSVVLGATTTPTNHKTSATGFGAATTASSAPPQVTGEPISEAHVLNAARALPPISSAAEPRLLWCDFRSALPCPHCLHQTMRTKSFYRVPKRDAITADTANAMSVDGGDVYVYCQETHGAPCKPELTWWEPREPDACDWTTGDLSPTTATAVSV